MGWSTSGLRIQRAYPASPTWECSLPQLSIPCSLPITRIDRLRSFWTGMAGNANPANDQWLNQQPFYFYNQAETWTGILVSQMLDPKKVAVLPLSATPLAIWRRVSCSSTSQPTDPQSGSPRWAPLSVSLVSVDTGAQAAALPPQPTTLRIAVPQEARQRITELATATNPATLVLRIDGVEIPADRGAVVQVFVNRPDVTAPAEGPEPGYLGSIVIVPSAHSGPPPNYYTEFRLPVVPEGGYRVIRQR